MGRFQVSVTKISGNQHSPRSLLHVDVKSFAENTTDDPNRNLTSVSVFNILEPQAQSIRIEALSDFSSILQSNSSEILKDSSVVGSDAPVGDVKSVQILHKRKCLGLGGALLVKDLTGNNQESPDPETDGPTPIEFNNDGGKSVQVNVRELKFNEKVTIIVDALDRKTNNLLAETDNQDDNNNMESENVKESTDTCLEEGLVVPEDANIEQNAENSSAKDIDTNESVEKKSTEETLDKNTIKEIIPDEEKVNPELKGETKTDGESEEVIPPDVTQRSTSPNLVFVIANALRITVEVDSRPLNPEDNVEIALNTLNNNPNWATSAIPEASEESVIEPGTILDFPWRKKADPTTATAVPAKKVKQRETRKELFKKLIQQRLLAFGLPYDEAFTITDAWHTGYVQQRAWSYRVPKSRPKWDPPVGLNPTTEIQVKAEAFAYNLLRNAEILQGTLDGATCTVIEATFFLMIPHAKMTASGHNHRNSNHLESFTSPTFIIDWIQVIFAAAHQLKPSEPNSVTGIVEKETKLLRNLLMTVRKASLKIKRKFKNIQQNMDTLRKKMLSRVEPNPKWKGDNSNRHGETSAAAASVGKIPGSIQVPEGLTAENLFENYIHVAAGRSSLVIRRQLTDPWCPLDKLNFLERRVLFLGLTDHMFSTFDTILSTLRHLQELYTHGYPLNIVARLSQMLELVRDQSRPYEYLSPQTRSSLYSKTRALSEGLDRFCYTFSQLSKLTKEANHVLKNVCYNPTGSEEFMEKIGLERMHIHLVVPFTTLSLKGLNAIKLRGRGLPHEQHAGTESRGDEKYVDGENPQS